MKNFYFDHIDQSYVFQEDGINCIDIYPFLRRMAFKYPVTTSSNPFTLFELSGSEEQTNIVRNLFERTSFGVDLSFWHRNVLLKSISIVLLLFAYLLYI